MTLFFAFIEYIRLAHHLTDYDLSQSPRPQIYVDVGVQNVNLFLRIFYKKLGTL